MKEYYPPATTGLETIRRYGDLAARGGEPSVAAQAWTDAGFDDATAARWLEARCFDPEAARALADLGVSPHQAAVRTRDGGDGRPQTIAYKVSNGDLTPRQAAARSLSSR